MPTPSPQSLSPGRWLARRIIVNGTEHKLSILTVSDSLETSIEPFVRETPATVYFSGTIKVVGNEIIFEP